MEKQKAKKRIEKLKDEINHHRYLYHVFDKQEISDSALDSLKHELYLLEKNYPEFIKPDSPTQRIGGKPLDKFKKVRHKILQWSFNDAFEKEEIIDFENRVKKILAKEKVDLNKDINLDYICELKIDGLHIILTYKNGILKTGATRGDGKIGEDVTQNLKTIESIPLKIEKNINIVAEGEVFMPKDVFEELNKQRLKNKESLFANPRNAAAGAVRQLDPRIARERKLDCFVYDLSWSDNFLLPDTQYDELNTLKNLGFKINKFWKYCKSVEEIFEYWNYWKKNKDKENYLIDGVVVKVNNRKLQEKIGYTGKSPRWAIAYKFPSEQSTTIIEDIKVQVGRTGALTPVAHLRPVKIMGATISRATLHNDDEIKRLGVKIGDTVIVQKAGDVIPEIISVVKGLRTGEEKEFVMPNRCPYCKTEVVKPKGEVAVYCPNNNCFEVEIRKLAHFVGKNAFDIEGLGLNKIRQLASEGIISRFTDIFNLKEGDLKPLERFGEKSSKNLVEAIEKSKNITLGRFIYALGIRHIGEETALYLAKKLKTVKRFENIKKEELENIKGIGPKVAESVYNYFHSDENNRLINRLFAYGVKIKEEKEMKTLSNLEGLSFVITGVLKSFSREKAKEKIRLLGGSVHSSVSKNTNYVVVGEKPGEKFETAKKLGVKTINENEFLELLK